jgi:hypothetical protein
MWDTGSPSVFITNGIGGPSPSIFYAMTPRGKGGSPGVLLHGLMMTIRLSLLGDGAGNHDRHRDGPMPGESSPVQPAHRQDLCGTHPQHPTPGPNLFLLLLLERPDYVGPGGGCFHGVPIQWDPVFAEDFFSHPPPCFPLLYRPSSPWPVFEGAYITEIVRAGVQSIEKGIWEAAHALGLSRWQQLRYVVLPLAAQRILPPLAGQFISTIKDSAIVSVISIQELTFRGMELMSATYLIFEVWITITVLYLILTLSLSLVVSRVENYLRRSEA